jgi:hypothetical protein
MPSVANWEDDVKRAAELLDEKYSGQQKYALAYSIGATVLIDGIIRRRLSDITHMFLVAPALSLRWKSLLLRPLLPLRHIGVSLPSASPKKYRDLDYLSLEAYKTSLDFVDRVNTHNKVEALKGIQATVVIHDEDEIVDPDGVRNWINNNDLKHWEIHTVSKENIGSDIPNHLMVNRATVGDRPWHELLQRLDDLLPKTNKAKSLYP